MEQPLITIRNIEDISNLIENFSYLSTKYQKIALHPDFPNPPGESNASLEQKLNASFNACGCAEGANAALFGVALAIAGIHLEVVNFWLLFPSLVLLALMGKLFGIWRGRRALVGILRSLRTHPQVLW